VLAANVRHLYFGQVMGRRRADFRVAVVPHSPDRAQERGDVLVARPLAKKALEIVADAAE